MRIQLMGPQDHVVSPQVFNRLFTMHGTTCSRRIRFLRFDWRMASPPGTHGTASRLRAGSLLESVLSNPQVKLRA
jgi:hypothetical protein